MPKKKVEDELQKAAYQEALATAKKLLKGKLSKEEFAQEQALSTLKGFRDSLTKLYNRDFFNLVVVIMLTRAKREKEPLTMLMLDLDDFKQINDQYGHTEGDRVLQKVGQAINESIRASDVAARYGGEEFAVLLPTTQENAAEKVVKRLLNNIAKIELKPKGKKAKITASLGLACFQKTMTPRELIDHADQALLQAKKSGKNQFIKYG